VGGYLEHRDAWVVLCKEVDPRKHQVKYPARAWALDATILDRAQAAGADRVEVADPDTRDVWWTSLDFLFQRGEALNRGHGSQVMLALTYWSFLPGKRGGNGPQLFPLD